MPDVLLNPQTLTIILPYALILTAVGGADRRGFRAACTDRRGCGGSRHRPACERERIDLLVMGAYGHSRIRSMLLGSTTTQLLRTCPIPVLLLR